MKINTNNWKEFKIEDVFKITRGKRLVEKDRVDGDIEYYSASEYNNGLTDKISNPLFIEKNSLIYTTFGKCFYVEKEFTASDEINILKNKNLNIHNGLFLATLINQNRYKYNFGRKAFKNKFSKDIIRLPILKSSLIDWGFMEECIKNLSREIKYDRKIKKEEVGNQKVKLNFENWKEFKIGDVLKLSLGKPIHSIEIDGIRGSSMDGIPYITRTAKNNGIEDFVNKSEVNLKKLSKGNCIIIGAEGFKAFYQDRDFITGNKINILRNKKINLFSALFLNTILNLIIKEKFGYGRGVVKFRLNDLYLKLPVNDRNEPDFEFMEDYIKSLPYSSSL